MRAGRIVVTMATILSFTFIVGTLGSAGGCSNETAGQAERDEAADKVAQDKMREFMKTKGPRGNIPKKGTKR